MGTVVNITTVKTTATFIKLQDGEWGLRVVGDCSPGMKVKVTKKNGTTSEQVIGRILGNRRTGYGNEQSYYICKIATAKQIEDFKNRLNSKPGATTYPKVPVPPDNGVIPFDPPYVVKE